MKKALSLVLALVMVLSMAVVGFAAKVDPAATYTFENDAETATIVVEITDGIVDDEADPTVAIIPSDVVVDLTAYDKLGAEDTTAVITQNALDKTLVEIELGDKTVEIDGTITITFDNGDEIVLYVDEVIVEPAKDPEAQDAVKIALNEAVAKHTTEVVIDAADLDANTLTAADFAYITNSFDDTWDWTAKYLGFEVTVINGTTIFDLGLVDYTWTKAIDFSVKYADVVTAAQYNMIRKLTGDTKNPLVWGFSGDAVPAGTEVDMVIPQAWINYYGHKNLTLFAWTAPITATYDNGANAGTSFTVEDAKVLAETTLDVNTTVTQRIQFTTDTLYKTLVLSANGTPVEGGAAEDNKDANPNTGANDIVNVAVVFAVVSLAAAGALVCKKSK